MQPKSVALPSFGGLDLRDDPEEVGLGAAIDMLNMDLDRRGRLRTRNGLLTFGGIGSLYGSLFSFLKSDGRPMLLAHNLTSTKIDAFDSTGTLVASSSVLPPIPVRATGFAAIGTPSASYVYVNAPGGPSARFDGATWSTVTLKNSYHLAVQQSDNRLVCAGEGSLLSRVWFSDPGAPETFGANNWVDLTPGDGEIVSGVAYWRNQLYVFKQSKFFIFYGNTSDGSGNPIFNYRPVYGAGAIAANGSVVVGPDGVYFIGPNGLFRTQGGDAERISGPIDPVWWGLGNDIPQSWNGQVVSTGPASMRLGASDKRIFCSFLARGGSATVGSTFVWDCELRTWLYWEGPQTHIVSMPGTRTDGGPTLVSSFSVSTAGLGKFDASESNDFGASFTGRYRTGFWSPGAPGAEVWIRELLLIGSGSVTVKAAFNDATGFTGPLGTGQTVTLGSTIPTITVSEGRDRRGFRARNVSWGFSGSSAWGLSQVVPIIWGQRQAGEQAA